MLDIGDSFDVLASSAPGLPRTGTSAVLRSPVTHHQSSKLAPYWVSYSCALPQRLLIADTSTVSTVTRRDPQQRNAYNARMEVAPPPSDNTSHVQSQLTPAVQTPQQGGHSQRCSATSILNTEVINSPMDCRQTSIFVSLEFRCKSLTLRVGKYHYPTQVRFLSIFKQAIKAEQAPRVGSRASQTAVVSSSWVTIREHRAEVAEDMLAMGKYLNA